MGDKTKTISFRIRKIDSDIAEAISKIEPETLADLCRNGLRVMLGIGTTRTTHIIEHPINVPLRQQQPQRQPEVQQQSLRVTLGNQGMNAPYKPKS